MFDFFLVELDSGTWKKLEIRLPLRERERIRTASARCNRRPSPLIGHRPRRRRRRRDKTGPAPALGFCRDCTASGRRLSHASACLFPRARYTLPPRRANNAACFIRIARPIRPGKIVRVRRRTSERRSRSVVRERDVEKDRCPSSDDTEDFGRR